MSKRQRSTLQPQASQIVSAGRYFRVGLLKDSGQCCQPKVPVRPFSTEY